MKKSKKLTLQEKELRKVTRKLDKELCKRNGKPDMAIVNECFRKLDELQGGVCKKTDAELEAGLIEVKKEGDRIKAEIAKNEISHSCNVQRKIPLGKRVAIAMLSIFLVIGLSFSALAISLGGYSKAWECVSNSVKTLFNTKNSENIVNGVNIIKGDYRKKYNNIEELLMSENIDILYPSKLPDGVEIETIRYIDLTDSRYKIVFVFNSIDFNISFYNYKKTNIDILDNNNTYKTELIDFYIVSKNENGNTVYNAVAQYDNCEYIINSDSYKNLTFIIDNLKEVIK